MEGRREGKEGRKEGRKERFSPLLFHLSLSLFKRGRGGRREVGLVASEGEGSALGNEKEGAGGGGRRQAKCSKQRIEVEGRPNFFFLLPPCLYPSIVGQGIWGSPRISEKSGGRQTDRQTGRQTGRRPFMFAFCVCVCVNDIGEGQAAGWYTSTSNTIRSLRTT